MVNRQAGGSLEAAPVSSWQSPAAGGRNGRQGQPAVQSGRSPHGQADLACSQDRSFGSQEGTVELMDSQDELLLLPQ